jgi:hypothetical protein
MHHSIRPLKFAAAFLALAASTYLAGTAEAIIECADGTIGSISRTKKPCTVTGKLGECAKGERTCDMCGESCGSCQQKIFPTAETCDNKDNDCDGLKDEGLTQSCDGPDGDFCKEGVKTCAAGVWSACSDTTTTTSEQCNGIDDNCNNLIDENWKTNLPGVPSLGGLCFVGVGACYRTGTYICNSAGTGVTCSATPGTPTAETCNNIDDDCDGTRDEGLTQACGTDTGACVAGTQTCSAGVWGTCIGSVGPVAETCNGIDDNCDGMVDNGITCGGCTPVAEICNNIDDDCDGVIDEGIVQACGIDTGACVAGTRTCSGGVLGPCVGEVGPVAETCNNIDDDCDGSIDEGITQACGTDTGACVAGTQTCSAGVFGACTGSVGPTAETCNNIDDDCDGAIDESLTQSCGTDEGACVAGTQTCVAGAWGACTGGFGPVAEVCGDTIDNDCDGVVDNGCAEELAAPVVTSPWNGYTTGSGFAEGTPPPPSPPPPRFKWDAVSGAVNYQLQADDTCASGFPNCGIGSSDPAVLASPELDITTTNAHYTPGSTELPVSTTPPVGKRYYWRVRACGSGGSCSDWSPVRYIDIGRSPDFDGDGFSDLIAGAELQYFGTQAEGMTFVFDGSSSGIPSVSSLAINNPDSTSNYNTKFGYSVAAGDFNGDGFADLVVGAPEEHGGGVLDPGKVFIFNGSAGGLAHSLTLDNPLLESYSKFGASVASAGDVNGDGFADLVVGSYRHDINGSSDGDYTDDEGVSYVYYGSAGGLPATPSVTLNNPAAQALGNFGISVASAGDVNGDGYADVVVGAHMQDNGAGNEGNAFVYYGSAAGIPATPSATLDNPLNQPDGNFGISVASAGDVNGDGLADLIVGASMQNNGATDEGTAYLFYGATGGISATPSVTIDSPLNHGGDRFGVSVASAGDVNGDGLADLVVGAYRQDAGGTDSNEGAAHLYYGSASLPASGLLPSVTLNNPQLSAAGGQDFGFSVSSGGDLNGDGYFDLIVGAHMNQDNISSQDEGHVYVYYGSATGIPATPSVTLDNPSSDNQGHFGISVSSAGGR